MEEYRLSQQRGKTARLRELARQRATPRPGTGGQLCSLGVFARTSYLGVGNAGDPATYDERWMIKTDGHVFCDSTTRGKGRQILPQTPPHGRLVGDSYSPRKFFSEFAHKSEGGVQADRVRESVTLDSTVNIGKRLSSRQGYNGVHPFRVGSPNSRRGPMYLPPVVRRMGIEQ